MQNIFSNTIKLVGKAKNLFLNQNTLKFGQWWIKSINKNKYSWCFETYENNDEIFWSFIFNNLLYFWWHFTPSSD
jgi:hypothetical protein